MDRERLEFVEKMKGRTKRFAVDTIQFFRILPKNEEARIIGRQLLRSATSVAANYRAACRARSGAEYFAKLSIVVEESDETLLWIEILEEAEIVPADSLSSLKREATEILSIMATARKNTDLNRKK